ncbi:hypothetical protein J2Z31_002662 [Sinorhizobium kostiense]|uniref:Uncharacterized protein n=1 Tax=Sinorhizobium kostiense TaxID=76747 RepID=A0ABS4QZT7_9HYPH|nr:hypothetical protein [Sinorhizobium kostiense]MBP2236148.1 hypothetical protein [Sinorhizobium kostiense]
MKSKITASAFLMTLAISSLASSGAWAYCSEPSAPSCADGYGSFQDEWEFNSCKSDMETYKSEIEDFISCKQREVDEANEAARKAAEEAEDVARRARNAVEQATSDYNDAVRDFNTRASN